MSPIIVIWDPEILKEIYVKKFHSFPDRQKSLLKINGEMNEGLTSTSGNQWKRIRSTLTPAFSSAKLKEMFYIADNRNDKLLEKLHAIVQNKEGVFSPSAEIGRFTLDVVLSAAFSTDFHVQDGDEVPPTVKLMKESISSEVFQDPVVILCSLFPYLERIFELMDYSIFSRKLRTHICQLTEAMIRAKNNGVSKRTDLMQQMLGYQISKHEAKTASKGLTQKEIVGNSFLMLFAGYDTTQQSLTYLFYNLARHPEVQDRLRSEIEEAMQRNDNKITYQTINDVKYMTQCINESLRVYPVVPMNTRVCDHEVTIKGIKIPQGTEIQVPLQGLSHCEDYWDEPHIFNPDRMEDMSRIDPMVFQPFGGGPRSCIGMRFAMMVMKLAICRILTKYRIVTCEKTLEPPLEITLTLTTSPKKEIFLKLEDL